MSNQNRDPFDWIAAGPPASHGSVPLRGSSYLLKLDDGALLSWTFAEPGDLTYTLMARLTDNEAQKVFEGDDSTGMIEPIRATMRHPGALVLVSTGPGEGLGRRILIPREVTEWEFIDDLMRAADTIDDHYENITFAMRAQAGSMRAKLKKYGAKSPKAQEALDRALRGIPAHLGRDERDLAKPFLKLVAS
ncbi:hypothetical protein [Candidatus Mycobacterium methanotrophicum]|uniref:Uncharacterized protein n=1 Tax=Candidatus Mycobacterium methanotrophicum TaxID=2943498 RepID=A0ABY4QS75_9MYCO|nr:hypothetical protein [Candidatus Mycobacterium methanotrophicum]UQX12786.1 hypothetical protein M5I08_11910 [Candidatus Mycobacterium methanotrophicum]